MAVYQGGLTRKILYTDSHIWLKPAIGTTPQIRQFMTSLVSIVYKSITLYTTIIMALCTMPWLPRKCLSTNTNLFARHTVIKNTDLTSNTFFGATSTEMEQSVTNTTTIVSREVEVKSKVQPLFEIYLVSIILGSFNQALFFFTGWPGFKDESLCLDFPASWIVLLERSLALTASPIGSSCIFFIIIW